ncbi:hypothetical protein K458DRAFT_488145 [Lentithecium fluviatile CBS 122367]|uniref:Uncharacterized protein n=1 Tax=Lentithecium fluviatile CBS 122367 TaxID=1168545 RepID=A0A6G1IY72_9PLEO|nr:hypothetical protein K458DRAFT_488145 [Lentithecium fluviatile CBS 122367]
MIQESFLLAPKKNDDQWTRHLRTVTIIRAAQFLAIASAVGHYLLFRTLDRTPTDEGYLRQSQLLVTIFKGTFTTGVGISFAQNLWRTFRGSATAVSLVETLFLLRSSVLTLADLRSILRAPLLYLMALFVWFIGIATIYPPGALTVDLRPNSMMNNVDISVWNHGPGESFNIMMNGSENRYSTLALQLPEESLNQENHSDERFFNYPY